MLVEVRMTGKRHLMSILLNQGEVCTWSYTAVYIVTVSSISHISSGLHQSASTSSSSGMTARKESLPRVTISTPSPPLDSSSSSSTCALTPDDDPASPHHLQVQPQQQQGGCAQQRDKLNENANDGNNLKLPSAKRFLIHINFCNPIKMCTFYIFVNLCLFWTDSLWGTAAAISFQRLLPQCMTFLI